LSATTLFNLIFLLVLFYHFEYPLLLLFRKGQIKEYNKKMLNILGFIAMIIFFINLAITSMNHEQGNLSLLIFIVFSSVVAIYSVILSTLYFVHNQFADRWDSYSLLFTSSSTFILWIILIGDLYFSFRAGYNTPVNFSLITFAENKQIFSTMFLSIIVFMITSLVGYTILIELIRDMRKNNKNESNLD